jgi:ribosomal protein L11 methyltransferase
MLTLETQNLHPSTLLCLEALQSFSEDFQPLRVLDLGCGNGILSILTAELWPDAKIDAVDISENAVRDATAAIREQGLEHRITVQRNDAFYALNSHFSALNCSFDLILCNLLADILIPCAPGIKARLAPGGRAILSGILAWKSPEIETVYNELAIDFTRKFEDLPWVCYTLCHKTETIFKPIVTKA